MNYRKYIIIVNFLFGKFWGKCLSLVLSRQYRKIYNSINVGKYQCTSAEVDAFRRRWNNLGRVDSIYFKLFSCYVEPSVDFIPEDISHNIVEPLLNPPIYRGLYNDKNMFDMFLLDIPDSLPLTFVRRIRGFYYDKKYNRISLSNESFFEILNSVQRIVVKKTKDTSSGNAVFFFVKSRGKWINEQTEETLSLNNLNSLLGDNYIVQEALVQSDFMAQFNMSSVNTIRILVYRSVKDDRPHVVNAIMRIGKAGAVVDNAHQGGATIGISKNGQLNSFLVNQYGQKYTVFNNIDFSNKTFVIPNWLDIVAFAHNGSVDGVEITKQYVLRIFFTTRILYV